MVDMSLADEESALAWEGSIDVCDKNNSVRLFRDDLLKKWLCTASYSTNFQSVLGSVRNFIFQVFYFHYLSYRCVFMRSYWENEQGTCLTVL